MTATIGVVVFPGTNCEHDVVSAVEGLGGHARLIWHGDASLGDVDAVILPGGFAHGDYLRPGAIARFSRVMAAVGTFASAGGPVVGICNGFQVLTEAGLLPGALGRNAGLAFICAPAEIEVVSERSPLTAGVTRLTRLQIPINHFEGRYLCDRRTLDELRGDDRIVLRYVDNPNGSLDDIAGIANASGNVVGLMPHPERACEALVGGVDGAVLLAALLRCAGASVTA